ncbi:MAG: hypothetical protein JW957_02450 [Candidatus Omnitrophica bacterium]|nr:hypothetical protein [Candidatus Omnitrophota bacterium]
MSQPIAKSKNKKNIAVLTVFAVAMAYVEAMVVVYLRRLPAMSDWPRLSSYRDLCLFVANAGIMWSEQTREFATIVMLLSVAFFFGKNLRERIAGFLIAFGIWDIFYYIFLYLRLRWPENLLTMDILFLIPCPWVSPVILPVIISLIMIFSGFRLLKYLPD